ncbi:Questin oxidase [Hyphodiscus hymeniophilus]|uniref:Questin oxidase n=1 Tax=Hyphodiscus hymeniophilus TaxID=353542 RepID=A0A9P6VEQ3_9HELO|nr:Questin oxidase [Hyphodiscus hymeniophilus]
MATPNKIHLSINDTGVVHNKPQNEETAARTSELLQENHDKHHIFFNQDGFHNHIAHHLLTLYGLGAPTSVIEKQYKHNVDYQRPNMPVEDSIVEDMSNPEHFQKYLGKEKYYRDFLIFWQNEMEKSGWEDVLNKNLFEGGERANDLLTRMYAGFLHPLIHLGFGIEFKQPAIIAEALAQACIHDSWISPYLLKCEAASTSGTSDKILPQLIDEIRSNSKLSNAAHWEDGNKIRDGILKRAPDEMISIARQWNVSEDQIGAKTAEMISTAVYFTSAAQKPPKQVKFDFYYMHCVNASIFFPTFNAQTWLSAASKVRLLKFKAYIDLAMYASRHSPPLLLEEIALYTPKKLEKGDAEWPGLFQRLFEYPDDGHAVKLARAVRNAQSVSEEYEGKVEWDRVKGFMWEKIGNMVVDSVEDTGNNWVRSAGFEEAWTDFEDRPREAHL